MDRDPLDIIAEAYRLTAETHRLGLRVQAFAVALIVLSLLGMGVLFWQHGTQTQALRDATETLTVQTEALREVLRQGQNRP
jgi:hypothetical protein